MRRRIRWYCILVIHIFIDTSLNTLRTIPLPRLPSMASFRSCSPLLFPSTISMPKHTTKSIPRRHRYTANASLSSQCCPAKPTINEPTLSDLVYTPEYGLVFPVSSSSSARAVLAAGGGLNGFLLTLSPR